MFRNAIDHRARARYRAEKAAADANGEKVKSTAAQRRHDALHELILQATAAGDDGNGLNVPAITAIIDVTKLPDAEPAEIVGETEAGTPVTAQRPRCGGAATPASPASSPDPTPPPSTSATPPGSPTAPNAAPSPPETAAAPSRAVTDHPAGPAPTTSPTGSTAERPASGTRPCCAASTTTASTKAASDSNASPTAN